MYQIYFDREKKQIEVAEGTTILEATAGWPSSRCALRRSRYLRKMPGNGEGTDFTGLPDKDSGRSSC